jgi:hypothetical protein
MSQEDDEWDDWGDESQPLQCRPQGATQEQVAAVVQKLKNLQLNICDSAVCSSLTREMNQPSTERRFQEVQGYYEKNIRKLQEQTRIDMSRLQTEVKAQLTEEQSSLTTTTDPSEIEALMRIHQQRGLEMLPAQSLVWALANQSIWANLLADISRAYGLQKLSISIVSTDTTMSLTFREAKHGPCIVSTSSHLVFSTTIQGQGQGLRKIELASLNASINVSVQLRDTGLVGSLEQSLHSPALCPVFDEDLELAAKSILELEGEGTSGDADEFGGPLEIDEQAKQLTKHVASSLKQLARDVKTGIGEIGRDLDLDLDLDLAPKFEKTVEGLVRSLGTLVGVASEEEVVNFRELARSASGSGSSSKEAPPPPSQAEKPRGGQDVCRLFDKVSDSSSSSGSGSAWGGWAAGLVRSIGTLVQADQQEEEDEGLTLYRKEPTTPPLQQLLTQVQAQELAPVASRPQSAQLPPAKEPMPVTVPVLVPEQEQEPESSSQTMHQENVHVPTPPAPSYVSVSMPVPESEPTPKFTLTTAPPAPPSDTASPTPIALRARPKR